MFELADRGNLQELLLAGPVAATCGLSVVDSVNVEMMFAAAEKLVLFVEVVASKNYC